MVNALSNNKNNITDNEEWRNFPIEPFTFYLVSNHGRIKNSRTNKILNPGIDSYGYKKVILNCNCVRKSYSVHRAVMLTFNPIDNAEQFEVNHKDCNKLNNKLDNLEWLTHADNFQHAINNGRIKGPIKVNEDIVRSPKLNKKNITVKLEKDLIKLLVNYCKDNKIDYNDYINNLLKFNKELITYEKYQKNKK